MTSQSDFLSALGQQCADLRTNIEEEYQSSIATLESRLRSLSAENDELRMQVKRLPLPNGTWPEKSQERMQENSHDIEGGEKEARLLSGKVEVPGPTAAREPRIAAPPVMITSDAENAKMHIQDVEDCAESSTNGFNSVESRHGNMVKTIIIPGYINSAPRNMDLVESLLPPCPPDAQEPGGLPVKLENTPNQEIQDSEHKHKNGIQIGKSSSTLSPLGNRSAQEKTSKLVAARRRVSLDSRREDDESNEQADDKPRSKPQSTRPKAKVQLVSVQPGSGQENERHEDAQAGFESNGKEGSEAAKMRCAFAVELDGGQSDEDADDDGDDDEHPARVAESGEDSDSDSNSEKSSEDGEQYMLAAIWTEQNSDTIGIRTSRGVMGSQLTAVPKEQNQPVDYDVTQEISKASEVAKCAHFVEKHCMLHPYSRLHVAWETVGLLLLLYDMTVVPLAIFEPDETDFTTLMTWAVRTFWTFDIAVSFLTGYLDNEGITVMTLHKVARNYGRTQLPLDLIVVLFDWLDAIIGVRATGVMKGGRVLRIMRLVRMRKARQLWLKLSEYVNADKALVFLKTGTNLSILLMLLHFVACFWWAIGLLEIDSGKTWIDKGGFSNLSVGQKYLMSAHMGLANFYGEHLYIPETIPESIYSLVLLYFAFICQMWMVSSITTAMTHLEIVSSKRTHMFTALDKFMSTHQVSRELRLKVHRSARHALVTKEQNTMESDIELLQLISQPMMIRLHVQMFAPFLQAFPFLRCFMLADGAAARQLCHVAVTVDQCNKDDVIFAFQEKPVSGKVRFVSNSDLSYADAAQKGQPLSSTDWLSEMVLWSDDWFHRGTARASSDCQVVCLDAEMFRKRVGSPAVGASARVYARLRLNQINGDPDCVSDLGVCDGDMDRILGLVFPEIWQSVSHEYLKGSTDTPLNMAAKLRTSAALLGRYSSVGLPRT